MSNVVRIRRFGRSFTGHPLAGGRPLKLAYLDEAGTGGEDVTIVAAVIVDADRQYRLLEDHLDRVVRERLSPDLHDGFIFHAKDISAGNKEFSDLDEWPFEKRKALICEMLQSRPQVLYSVAVGYANHSEETMAKYSSRKEYLIRRHEEAYAMALLACEDYMRQFAGHDEVCLVIAEDLHNVRKRIRTVHDLMIAPNSGFPIAKHLFPMRHIKESVHFTKKNQARLLQYADSCAFAFRRFYSGFAHGDDYVAAVLPGDARKAMDQLLSAYASGAGTGRAILAFDLEGRFHSAEVA